MNFDMNPDTTLVFGGGGFVAGREGQAPKEFEPSVIHALRLSPAVVPNLLIIPTPLEDDDLPCPELDDALRRYSSPVVRAGHVKTLTASTQEYPDKETAASLIEWADVILILGGLFPEQVKRFRKTGIDQLLIAAARAGGKVFAGSSTGMIIWFRGAQTIEKPLPKNPKKRYKPAKKYYVLDAMGFFPAYVCPHFSEGGSAEQIPRPVAFDRFMATQPIGTVGLGVNTDAVIVVHKNLVTVHSDNRYSRIFRAEVMEAKRQKDKPGKTRKPESRLKYSIHRPGDPPIPAEFFFGTSR